MILLTDEEIRVATGWDYLSGDELILLRTSNEAQLKKVVEWLDSISYINYGQGKPY